MRAFWHFVDHMFDRADPDKRDPWWLEEAKTAASATVGCVVIAFVAVISHAWAFGPTLLSTAIGNVVGWLVIAAVACLFLVSFVGIAVLLPLGLLGLARKWWRAREDSRAGPMEVERRSRILEHDHAAGRR